MTDQTSDPTGATGAEVVEPAGGGIQSVLNALKILESIAAEQPVGVSQLSRKVSLPKSSVQRALRTLDQAGWIRPVEGDQTRWELTSWMLAISLKAFGEYSLRDYAEPAMDELRRRTNETIHLVCLDGDSCLVIDRIDSFQAVRAFVEVGSRSPLHATASGQAIMAFMPEARVDEVLAAGLSAYTPRTYTDPEAIKKRLETVRERGYAVNIGEWRPEVASISAPILSLDGSAIAAMTISIPINRYSDDLVDTYGGYARELTQGLAGLGQRARLRGNA